MVWLAGLLVGLPTLPVTSGHGDLVAARPRWRANFLAGLGLLSQSTADEVVGARGRRWRGATLPGASNLVPKMALMPARSSLGAPFRWRPSAPGRVALRPPRTGCSSGRSAHRSSVRRRTDNRSTGSHLRKAR